MRRLLLAVAIVFGMLACVLAVPVGTSASAREDTYDLSADSGVTAESAAHSKARFDLLTGMGEVSALRFVAASGASTAPPRSLIATELGEGPVDRLLYGGRPGEGLPGRAGVDIPNRPTITEMENLTEKHGVEFATTYKHGPGPNGAGGQYRMFSGDATSVGIPIEPDSMLIYHTHPGGTPWASGADRAVMDALEAVGSPQRTSCLIPVGMGCAIPFKGNT